MTTVNPPPSVSYPQNNPFQKGTKQHAFAQKLINANRQNQVVTLQLWTKQGGGVGILAISDGGTGASTAAGARTNLGLEIGTDVQAYSIYLDEANSFFIATDITGAEAETLTDGSNADLLHEHAHDQTTGLQGGVASEYYHLTQTQHDTLTDGSDAIGLHTHNTEIAARVALRI